MRKIVKKMKASISSFFYQFVDLFKCIIFCARASTFERIRLKKILS